MFDFDFYLENSLYNEEEYTYLEQDIFNQIDLDCFYNDFDVIDIEEEYIKNGCAVFTATCKDHIKVTLKIYDEDGVIII